MGDVEKTGQRATREERGYGQTTGIQGCTDVGQDQKPGNERGNEIWRRKAARAETGRYQGSPTEEADAEDQSKAQMGRQTAQQ